MRPVQVVNSGLGVPPRGNKVRDAPPRERPTAPSGGFCDPRGGRDTK